MAVGSDDPAIMLAEAYPSVDWEQRFLLAGQSPAIYADARPLRTDASAQYTPRFNSSTPRPEAQGLVRGNRRRSATVTVIPQRLPSSSLRNIVSATPADNIPRTSDITPIFIPSRSTTTSPATPQSPFIPSTPPSQMMPLSQLTPSPAPTVTPRLLTWSSRQAVSPGSPPQGNSPLTNPSARMSLAHIVPTLIRVRDVVI